jgi:hypothetical protein
MSDLSRWESQAKYGLADLTGLVDIKQREDDLEAAEKAFAERRSRYFDRLKKLKAITDILNQAEKVLALDEELMTIAEVGIKTRRSELDTRKTKQEEFDREEREFAIKEQIFSAKKETLRKKEQDLGLRIWLLSAREDKINSLIRQNNKKNTTACKKLEEIGDIPTKENFLSELNESYLTYQFAAQKLDNTVDAAVPAVPSEPAEPNACRE